MQKWQERFYNSRAWKLLRAQMIQSRQGVCNMCGDIIVGSPEVHHKIALSEANVSNPQVSLNPALLEVLHKECHDKRHGRFATAEKVIIVDDDLSIDYGRRQYAKPV
jgi:5-methylcytosine-specific restriction endonuclease McrA